MGARCQAVTPFHASRLVLAVLFSCATPSLVTAQYAGDIGWIFTGDDTYNTAGDDAAVGGGDFNTAQGTGTFALGGSYNSASGTNSFIGGGFENTIEQTAQASVIGGGEKNFVSSRYSLIVGGLANAVTANYGSILGGYKATVSGNFGVVVGGSRNAATAKISTALGFRARADHAYSLVLGFGGTTIGDCQSTQDSQVTMCCDSWTVNGIEMTDLFSRRHRRVLTEYSVAALADQGAPRAPNRRLHSTSRDDASDSDLLTRGHVQYHEERLAETRRTNAELAETIALLSQEIDALAAAQSQTLSEEVALRASRRRLVDGVETEYIEDSSANRCASAELIASSGSGETACATACDTSGIQCGAFLIDASNNCHTFHVCSYQQGTSISGTVFKKQRVNAKAYDVDVLAYVDYQLMLAEEQMDLLEYETRWGAIQEYIGGTCSSGGDAYLAVDVANAQLYLCDGGGSWVELTLLDTIPAPAGSNAPAPWHSFDNITQDVWNNTDTHRYVQSGPLEEAAKPHDIDQCLSNPCENGGTCIDHGGALTVNDPFDTFECVCADGWENTTCNVPVDDCTSDPCANNATCTQDTYGYQCECLPGYNGFDCDSEIDECKYSPCVHGTCVDEIDSFSCICESGWDGATCDVLLLSEGYYSLGAGQCADSTGKLPNKCTSSDAAVGTLFNCMQACDATAECEAVQFRHATSVCSLMLYEGVTPSSIASHFVCTNTYNEIYREDFEDAMVGWTIDPGSTLQSTGLDTNYVRVGNQAFRMSGGKVVDNTKVYSSYVTLTASNGIVAGVSYSVSVWVYHVSNIISSPQPSSTGSSLTISDGSKVFSSTATATADARHWELLSTKFTAQSDATLVVTISIPFNFLVDTYWDEVVVWSAAGRYTTKTDGSLIQAVECYRPLETPVDSLFNGCLELKEAGEPNGAYAFLENGTVAEYYCRDEDGGGINKLECTRETSVCDNCGLVFTESGAWTQGHLNDGLGQFAPIANWHANQKIRFEWFDAAGDWQWAQFRAASSIFQDRGNTTMTSSKEDNTIIDLDDFSTSVSALLTAVETAGGAIFCLSTQNDETYNVDVAWGVLPSDHVDFGAGCIGASWGGEGLFYGEQSRGPGFVGYVADGDAKGLNDGASHLDLNVYVCDALMSAGLQVWLRRTDYTTLSSVWADHRLGYPEVSVPAQDSDTPYLIYEASEFDIPELDIGPTAMPDLSISIWVQLLDIVGPGWLVTHDSGAGTYDRGIYLHDEEFSSFGNRSVVRAGCESLRVRGAQTACRHHSFAFRTHCCACALHGCAAGYFVCALLCAHAHVRHGAFFRIFNEQALGVGQTYTSDLDLVRDTWYHIVGVWRSDGTASLFLDGVVRVAALCLAVWTLPQIPELRFNAVWCVVGVVLECRNIKCRLAG